MSLVNGLKQENENLRFRTGSGTPEGNVLLGGTGKGEGVDTTFGSASTLGASGRASSSNKDTRVSTTGSSSSSSGSGTRDSGGSGNPTQREK